MQEDLAKERNATTRLWAKRETQIQGVVESTVDRLRPASNFAGLKTPRQLCHPKIAPGAPYDETAFIERCVESKTFALMSARTKQEHDRGAMRSDGGPTEDRCAMTID
ncbi:hypothetical protein X743_28495 [Mesorhizobium sp. LNHC252B00]|nr:hypothetical protein X743_28495 [Mesorhizobium sp. LNHC252B00]